MKLAKPLVASAILIGLMLAISAYAWVHLGDGPVATHFGADGRPNGFAPKRDAVLAMPILSLLLVGLLAGLPPIMPQRARLERSWGAYVTVWLAVLTLLLVVHGALMAYALGAKIDMVRTSVIGVGALIAVIGNLFGKVRYNYVFGIRTPWTLADERVWDKTHRFAGRGMVLGGLVVLIAGVSTPASLEPLLIWILMAGVLTPIVASTVYAYLESRRLERIPSA